MAAEDNYVLSWKLSSMSHVSYFCTMKTVKWHSFKSHLNFWMSPIVDKSLSVWLLKIHFKSFLQNKTKHNLVENMLWPFLSPYFHKYFWDILSSLCLGAWRCLFLLHLWQHKMPGSFWIPTAENLEMRWGQPNIDKAWRQGKEGRWLFTTGTSHTVHRGWWLRDAAWGGGVS